MALSRTENTSTLLGTRFGNQENVVAGKARLTSATARSALGNISNRAGLQQNKDAKGTIKDQLKPTTRLMTKSLASSRLKQIVEKENPVKVKEDLKLKDVVEESAASPMDMSANTDAFSRHFLPPNVADIDQDDHDNPQLVSTYVNDIYKYMRELERDMAVKKHYLDNTELNGRMRGILIDWLVQVHVRFHLLQETLFLTVAIIDRFLQVQPVSRSKLQLVGVTSMLIASKYEEMYAPEIADFVYITDNAYSKQDIRRMECIILKALNFKLGKPLPIHFLRRNSKAGEVDATKHTLAKYLMELSIVDYEMCHVDPSAVAAASLCLSIKVLEDSEWNDTLHHYSNYSEKSLLPIMQRMALLVTKSGSGKLTAIKTKYHSSKFMKISSSPHLEGQTIKDLAQAAV